MGSILNPASIRLKSTMALRYTLRYSLNSQPFRARRRALNSLKGDDQGTRSSLIGNPAMAATTKLESGPAAAVRPSAAFGLRVAFGLTGTDFPQPKPTVSINKVPTEIGR